MGDPGVQVRLVPLVSLHLLAEEGGQVLVQDDVLQGGDVEPPRGLKHVLVLPFRMGFGDAGGEDVVPSVEEDAQGEESRVLIRPWVTEHWGRSRSQLTFSIVSLNFILNT